MLAQAPGAGPRDLDATGAPSAAVERCRLARQRYEALAFEEALVEADAGLGADPGALGCLEVRALVLLASGRAEEARAQLTTLFEVAPDHVVRDPSLSPSTLDLIEQVREAVRPLTARVTVRWIVHTSLRLDVVLEGGLRDARRIRYRVQLEPDGDALDGEVPLVGRAATATVSVPAGREARTLTLTASVLDGIGRQVIPFSSQLLLPERPARDVERVTVAGEDGGVPWWVWVAIGAVVVGGAVTTAVVAQPDLPSGVGLGRAEL